MGNGTPRGHLSASTSYPFASMPVFPTPIVYLPYYKGSVNRCVPFTMTKGLGSDVGKKRWTYFWLKFGHFGGAKGPQQGKGHAVGESRWTKMGPHQP